LLIHSPELQESTIRHESGQSLGPVTAAIGECPTLRYHFAACRLTKDSRTHGGQFTYTVDYGSEYYFCELSGTMYATAPGYSQGSVVGMGT